MYYSHTRKQATFEDIDIKCRKFSQVKATNTKNIYKNKRNIHRLKQQCFKKVCNPRELFSIKHGKFCDKGLLLDDVHHIKIIIQNTL